MVVGDDRRNGRKSPAAVVINASAMPGATTRRLAAPAEPSPENASITPHTVPNNPMNGVTDPVVASHGMNFSSFRTSSDVASCIATVTAFRLVNFPCGLLDFICDSSSRNPAVYTASSGDPVLPDGARIRERCDWPGRRARNSPVRDWMREKSPNF